MGFPAEEAIAIFAALRIVRREHNEAALGEVGRKVVVRDFLGRS